MEKILTYLLEFRDNIKLFHLQTTSYSAHFGAHQLEIQFSKLLDKFVKIFQGIKMQRIGNINIQLSIHTLSTDEMVKYCKHFCDTIVSFINIVEGFNPSEIEPLNAVINDIQHAVYQFIYSLGLT